MPSASIMCLSPIPPVLSRWCRASLNCCFTLGLGDQLVGRTHYCIHPRLLVAKIPSVGGTKKIRYARLQALQPTHIIVNIDENRRELAERLIADGFQVIVTHPLTPEDNVPLYRLIGGIFNPNGGSRGVGDAI
jgi:ABC-type Fe3+-hydroxamate transport system substrate-binding protein